MYFASKQFFKDKFLRPLIINWCFIFYYCVVQLSICFCPICSCFPPFSSQKRWKKKRRSASSLRSKLSHPATVSICCFGPPTSPCEFLFLFSGLALRPPTALSARRRSDLLAGGMFIGPKALDKEGRFGDFWPWGTVWKGKWGTAKQLNLPMLTNSDLQQFWQDPRSLNTHSFREMK